jgi:transposase
MNDNKENINPESQEAEHHHVFSDYECGLIVGMYAVKKNAAAISRQFNFNVRNVRRVIKRFNETGSGLPINHSGMKRKLDEKDDRSLVRDAEKEPELTFEQHRANLAGAGVIVTLPTVSSVFHRLGYGSYVTAKKPRLSKA